LLNRALGVRLIRTLDSRSRALLKTQKGAGFLFSRFEKSIGYKPRSYQLFFEALLHRSYLQFVEKSWSSNERLEFLGDSVLNFIVAEQLWIKYPAMEEGNLTKLRSRLVNRKILAQRAKELSLIDYLFLSGSAAQSIGSGSDSVLADAFEAVLAAIYLDGGFEPARKFVTRLLLANEEVFQSAFADDNYKSALLEFAQGNALSVPRYTVLREEGPEHDRRFTVEVAIGYDSIGEGSGRSKKDAEQAAAAKALEQLNTHRSTKTQPPGQ
jgi:ribonuclease-3